MNYYSLEQYFKRYIASFQPFKSSKMFNGIIKFLIEYYLKHSYEKIPKNFKLLYEQQTIPEETYDSMLLSNGFPYEIIKTITVNEKYILLQSLIDFNKYKGSLKIINNIYSTLETSVNIYELFLNKKNGNWVFTPYPVYISTDSKTKVIEENIDYDYIYRLAPRYFIQKSELNNMVKDDNNNIILPFKTNLLFLDYLNSTNDSNTINLVLGSIFLKEYADENIILFFKDGQYNLKLKNIIRLWYWLIYTLYGTGMNVNLVDPKILFFDSNTSSYTIDDLLLLKDEYDSLSSSQEIIDFYKNKIEAEYLNNDPINNNYTNSEMLAHLETHFPSSLIEYITSRIGSNGDDEKENAQKKIIFEITDEIYNSIITWAIATENPLIIDTYRYLLLLLPTITFDVKQSLSFKLLQYLKPYHVDLVSQSGDTVNILDIFDNPKEILNTGLKEKMYITNTVPIISSFQLIEN